MSNPQCGELLVHLLQSKDPPSPKCIKWFSKFEKCVLGKYLVSYHIWLGKAASVHWVSILWKVVTDQPSGHFWVSKASERNDKRRQRQIQREVHCVSYGKKWARTKQVVVLRVSKAVLALFINCSVLHPLLSWQGYIKEANMSHEMGTRVHTPSFFFWKVFTLIRRLELQDFLATFFWQHFI